ncbi:hypothetical protein D920_01846 [Enterococcus faecalis 13-SD-W-01]|nr:hypothetical protein D920_01846 [Enterococcus faecalis 13-SD-W-01]
MIEIYLFVNPLGKHCYNIEQQILEFIEEDYGKKEFHFRFLPLVNLQTIGDVMQNQGISKNDIQKRNQLFSETYSAALDCKAAQFQGKKKGRQFLIQLQKTVGCEGTPYSPALAEKIFKEIGGDLAMFKEDRQSEFVKEAFFADQKIAREMGIVQHPSAVIYNYASERDFGVLVEGTNSIKSIKELCKTGKDAYQLFTNGKPLHMGKDTNYTATPNHLFLLSN